MKRPELELGNYEAIYDYYGNIPVNKPLDRFAHNLFRAVFWRSNTVYADGAQETLATSFGVGKQLILAANHVDMVDPLVLAGMARREQVLRSLVTNVIIPAKPPLFNLPVIGRAIDHLGAIPAIRDQDVSGEANLELTEEQRDARRPATEALINTLKKKFNEGNSVAIFPEQTRNANDRSKIQHIRNGIGKLACEVEWKNPPLMVFVGLDYGENKENLYSPNIAIDATTDVPVGSVSSVVELTGERLQSALDLAISIRK